MNAENEIVEESIDWKDRYIRLAADFDNFRKNKAAEIAKLKDTAGKTVIMDMIHILDEVIIAYGNSKDSEGFGIIYINILNTLKKYGVEKYGEVGEEFNPDLHDAISISTNGEVEKGMISFIMKYGYKMHGEIIRHAQVIVER